MHSLPNRSTHNSSSIISEPYSGITLGFSNITTFRAANMIKLMRTLVLVTLSSVSPALAQCGWPQEMLGAPATDQAGTYSCGARVNWLRTVMNLDEPSACSKVDAEFPQGPCGPYPYHHCRCPSCTSEVWTKPATDDAGTYTCGSRIEWLQSSRGYSEANACERVTSEFPGVCTCKCVEGPDTSRPTTAQPVSPRSKSQVHLNLR